MIALSIYVTAFLCNCILGSSSLLAPLKDDDMRIFKEQPNDLEYVLKRHSIDARYSEPDSKERRSTMGSSFIRFGRSQGEGDTENAGSSDTDSKVSRHPRWKSPDIVIRFGRSGSKNQNSLDRLYKRGRGDLNFIRYGRNLHVLPLELDVTAMCPEVLSGEVTTGKDLHPYFSRLLRVCNLLSNDVDRGNALDYLDDRAEVQRD
ncbi:hypothetical protein KM043_018721 [Ampulex compressa]|nr:hypothetical protein KM043_018721 [Ampulex compressa]